jgi:nucleoside-diphosphate-sugar epimerase
MKTLVIGGTGPTGPFIVNGLLRRGHQVSILHRGTHEMEFDDSVEHLHGDPHFVETLEETLGKRNFDIIIGMYGRLRYVAEVVKGRTPRFIAVGGLPYLSIFKGLHSPMGTPAPVSETDPLCTDEGFNKFGYLMALSERVVMEAHRQGDYSATLLRYPLVYGPRQLAPREWSLIRRFLDGRRRLILPNQGLTLVTRGYVENMAHTVLLAVDHPEKSSGEIYNVGDEWTLSVREWAVLTGRALGIEWELVSLPGEIARPSRAYAGRDNHQVLDLSKIKSQLGYRDIVPAQEAIRRTVEFYLENRPEKGGEEERQLRDAFDYDTEDRLIEQYRKTAADLREKASVGFQWRHPYAHPKKPGE